MPARIVLVHDDRSFLDPLVMALRVKGHDVATFDRSMQAWEALRTASKIELLITRIQFAPGQPHGIALAQWARTSCPGVRVLFVALPEFQAAAEGLGIFLPMPVEVPRVVEIVARLLLSDPKAWPL